MWIGGIRQLFWLFAIMFNALCFVFFCCLFDIVDESCSFRVVFSIGGFSFREIFSYGIEYRFF